jgi:hypothetical protein
MQIKRAGDLLDGVAIHRVQRYVEINIFTLDPRHRLGERKRISADTAVAGTLRLASL